MKRVSTFIFLAFSMLFAETLFEVKDASNNKVLDVSTDGLRVLNGNDTLMVISPAGVRVNLDNSANKALSRTFAVTTTASKNKGLNRVLEVGTEYTTMREGDLGERYTDLNTINTFIGLNAGQNNQVATYPGHEGRNNVFIGNNSGQNNTTGFHNTYLGIHSGRDNQTNFGNVYIGSFAGEENIYGGNTFIGNEAGRYGRNSFQSENTGGGMSNTFIGYLSGEYSTGNFNTCLGMASGTSLATGADNVYLGHNAGSDAKNGNGNVYIGKSAGGNYIGFENSGSNNVFIGKWSGSLAAGSGNVFIGSESGYNETLSNKLYIANTNTSTPLLKGTFPNTDLAINATDIFANGKLTIKGGSAIGMTQAGTVTLGISTQTGIKAVTLTFPKTFSSAPKISVTPKGVTGVNQTFGVTVRDITTTGCVIMVNQLSPTINGSWSQNLQADWIAWE
jgi:hypothetical protein